MKQKVFTLLTLLVLCVTGAWAGTETIKQGSWSSSSAYSGTSVSAAGTFSGGDGGGNITNYSPSNKGVKLNVKSATVSVSATNYGYVLFTVNTGYIINSLKLEGTSNGTGSIILKGVYQDVDAANLATSLASATNKYQAGKTFPNKTTNYVSSDEVALTATSNIVLLFDYSGSDSQMRAIFTINYSFAGPEITAQPKAAGYVLGEPASPLSVSATPSAGELSYQWYSNTSKTTEGAISILGATNATYTPSVASAGTTYYYCKVTDGNGNKNSDIIGVIVGNKKTARLPLTGSESITSNSFTSGDYAFSSTASIEQSSRSLYPAPHLKVNSGTITITATEDAIQFIKVIGSNNSSSATTITAGSGCTLLSDNKFIAVDTKDGDEHLVLSEVIIKPNTSSVGNSVSFVVGSQSRLYVEVYGTSTKVVNALISEYEWATFVSDKILDFTGLDVKAYAIIGHTDDAINKSAALTTVPANTPLLLNAAKGVYTIPVAASASPIGTNLLQAGDGSDVSAEDGKTKYVLSVVGGKAGFKKITAGNPATIAEGKAYLQFNEIISARDFLSFEDETTGINMVEAKKVENGVFYNLAGQQVAQPTKGLYIVNGRKVVIK